MTTNLHLVFSGQCSEAFAFYEKTFNSKIQMCMKYGEAPGQMPLTPTFWSPLFGMCTDKFGVAWMVSMPGPYA